MKVYLAFIFVLVVVGSNAEPPAYGAPTQDGSTGFGVTGGQIRRYVSVHIAPEEGPTEQARVIRVPGGDKHVNIIFVKTSSSSAQQQTEVILPEQPEHKNIVYVLLKKANPEDGIKIRRPSPLAPTKPEVFFIRYKSQDSSSNNGGGTGTGYGTPSASISSSSSYGAPF